jgi:uncharacterized protein (TIGR03089 family)
VTSHRSIPAAFAAAVAADPTRPLLTYYDDASGDRTELSGVTLANWVAKTANLLVDGCGLGPGDRAAVRLPAHWQTAAVLLGTWAAGLAVDFAGTPESPPHAPTAGAAVAFVAVDRVGEVPGSAGDVFALGLAPMAMPMRPGPPPGTVDYVAEVRGHGDRFAPAAPTRPGDPALRTATNPGDPTPRTALNAGDQIQRSAPTGAGFESHGQVVAAAAGAGDAAGLRPGDRVLVDADALPDPRDWLLTPLVAGASIVLVRNASADPGVTDRRLAAERVTHPLPTPDHTAP